MRESVVRGLVCCCVSAGAWALPTTAAASVRSQTVDVPQVAVVSAVATCPEGQRATGGGWESTPTVSSDVQVYPMESRKAGQRSWKVTGAQNSPNPSVDATMTAFVYCSKDAPKTTTKAKQIDLPDGYNQYATATAHCRGAGDVQAGGFSTPTNTSFSPFASVVESFRPSRDAWRTKAYGDASATLTSYSYCAHRLAPRARSGDPSPSSTHEDQVTATSGGCGAHEQIVAGGFSQTDEDAAAGSDFEGFYESFRSSGRWQVSGSHYGSAGSLYSIAYCG
jgi:hypothetical protein